LIESYFDHAPSLAQPGEMSMDGNAVVT
jgi:hypothetical protein